MTARESTASGSLPKPSSDRPVVLVVGHGMVGNKVVELLVRLGATRTMDVVVVGEEAIGGYDRVHLSSLFSGSVSEDLSLIDSEVVHDPAVTLITGECIEHLDREQRLATTNTGRTIRYRYAVLATGSVPFVPDVPGKDLPGCFVYRTLDDVDAIKRWSAGRERGVVIGGGLLGLEAANALSSCGLAVEIVEYAPWLMSAQLDEIGGDLLGRRVRHLGVEVHTATTMVEVQSGIDGAVERVELAVVGDASNRATLATDIVVFAAGIRPRDALARTIGLEVGDRGGIVVNSHCRTSDEDIFAVGECGLVGGRVYGLVSPGYQMARVVADNICGGELEFSASETPTKLKLLGVDVASFGDVRAALPGATTISFTDTSAMIHKRLITDDCGRLIGGVFVGDISGYDSAAAVAVGDADVPADLGSFIVPTIVGTDAPSAGVAALRDTATICSCENVTKGTICSSITSLIDESGCADVPAVKRATRAGTGCGGCIPQLTELVRAGLADRGIETVRHLCEHFSYSRQDLFDLIRLEGISTFSELLARHGTGSGCEICKPTVASILASVTSEYILDGEGAAIQDSNDHFLANLQKDGTYSVIPRIPGGEITASKLIVIGQVAEEFGLYVKLTGAQRVDLLGARVEQLPLIWGRLIDAGFESGHAYGKAVRTVKSCVGSTWCRFGVQDSTSLAIELELRYRGLRSPHKIKMAVSGCARECAEAQSKDVGVIATERGWNLYVCGNGGTRPRHADLLAEDLDTVTLRATIDRFLMYYVRTADRLQRTASWLDAMEGGLDHLRRVVVDDALGIGAELEADMARHVERYACEWKATLESPVRMRRFRTFVNSDEKDSEIRFVEERDQIRPAAPNEQVSSNGVRV